MSTTHTTLRAEGFTCPSCVAKLEKGLGRLPGVDKVAVKFASSRIEVDHDDTLSAADLVQAVSGLGYKSAPAGF